MKGVKTFYDWLIEKYGEEEGIRRYNEWKDKERQKIEDNKKNGQQTLF